MADESMQPAPGEEVDETLSPETEIPVGIDTLEADGVRPSVGDTVTLRVEGTVKSIKDDCCYVTTDKINDTDLEEILAEHAPENEDKLMERITREADMGGGYG
jgi:hypothetical protein